MLTILHCRAIGNSRFLANGSFRVANHATGSVNERPAGQHPAPKSEMGAELSSDDWRLSLEIETVSRVRTASSFQLLSPSHSTKIRLIGAPVDKGVIVCQ